MRPVHGPQSGFSLLELAVAFGIVGIFSGVLLYKMLDMEAFAERTIVDLTIANLRTGLRYRTGDLLIRDRVSEISTLADENPVNWLQANPPNYAGEFEGEPGVDLRGKWYFDKSRHELVYTVNNRRHFLPGSGQDYTVRWHAVRMQARENANPGKGASEQWVALVQNPGGSWF